MEVRTWQAHRRCRKGSTEPGRHWQVASCASGRVSNSTQGVGGPRRRQLRVMHRSNWFQSQASFRSTIQGEKPRSQREKAAGSRQPQSMLAPTGA